MPVKQPMGGAAQSNAILYYVGTAFSDGPNVSGLHFSFAAAIDDPKTRDRATLVVCITDLAAKVRIPNFSI